MIYESISFIIEVNVLIFTSLFYAIGILGPIFSIIGFLTYTVVKKLNIDIKSNMEKYNNSSYAYIGFLPLIIMIVMLIFIH